MDNLEEKTKKAIEGVCGEDTELLTRDDFLDVVEDLSDNNFIDWCVVVENEGYGLMATKYVSDDFSYTFYNVDAVTEENSVEDVIDLINDIDKKFKSTRVTFLEDQNG